ncbi:LMBR1-like membrane protein-domain-containing protein [Catenaria anguillulae PL171]|uniref:LMBR1-like membrane protein-domain-containing protein n=1 Tax=Catenaria anguillulae PL171 TaxID=765915 RepID=A0A1Y2HF62_9FUNG|nr:LMBR1-like membrane protein-domain-containing protein [Catenaria anguillulae PL171]
MTLHLLLQNDSVPLDPGNASPPPPTMPTSPPLAIDITSTTGTAWIIIGWLAVLSIALVTLLQLGNRKETPPAIGFFVFLGWAGPFSILYFLPLDLTSSKYRQCVEHASSSAAASECIPPLLYLSSDDLRTIWQSIYWTLFFITWFAIPILQTYCDSGGFTALQSLRKALRYNAWYYGTIGIVALVTLAYVTVVNGPPNWLALKSIGMALSNAYGLILLVLCLSYGIVDVPRELWLAADVRRSLTILEYRAVRYRDNLQAATRSLESIYREIAALDRTVPVSDHVRPYVDKLLIRLPAEHRTATVPTSSSTFNFSSWFSRGNNGASPSGPQPGSVTLKALQQLHRSLKMATLEYNRRKYKWDHLVKSALYYQDILDNEDNSDGRFHVIGRFVPPWQQRAEFIWFTYLRAWTLRAVSIVCGVMSLALVWSEVTMSMGLSVLALFTRTHSYTVLQAACITAVGYMTICTFVPLLSLRVFSVHQLAPGHHSAVPSLLFFAAQMTRFTFPMCWNFANLAEADNLVFSKVMGTVNLVPLLGEGFNDWVPISLVVLASMTLLNVHGRLFKCLKLDTAYVASEEEGDSASSDRADGRLLLQQARASRSTQVAEIGNTPLSADRQGLLSSNPGSPPVAPAPGVPNIAPILPDDAFVPLAKRGARGAARHHQTQNVLSAARAVLEGNASVSAAGKTVGATANQPAEATLFPPPPPPAQHSPSVSTRSVPVSAAPSASVRGVSNSGSLRSVAAAADPKAAPKPSKGMFDDL